MAGMIRTSSISLFLNCFSTLILNPNRQINVTNGLTKTCQAANPCITKQFIIKKCYPPAGIAKISKCLQLNFQSIYLLALTCIKLMFSFQYCTFKVFVNVRFTKKYFFSGH